MAKPKKQAAEIAETVLNAARCTKGQLVKSGLFPADVARAVLKDGAEYTVNEAADLINKYYERTVL